jgi:serine/threonine-protein kinase HipA
MELEVHWRGAQPARVGTLYQDRGGTVFFEYDTAWRGGLCELSPVYLPNSTQGAVSTPTPGFGPLHGLFQDVLPDWWGERLMRRHFESLGIPWSRVTALRKLACQGGRKMGALAFQPALDEEDFNDSMVAEIDALVDAARHLLRGEAAELLDALALGGMSPGGAHPKAALAISDDFSEIRLDDPPPAGFSAWLIKFDIDPVLHEGRIEAAYADMARDADIEVPETRLLESAGACHFLSRRFDRPGHGRRLHLHSYSGLTHTPLRDGIEYGELLDLTRSLTRDQRCVDEMFRRVVFNVVSANDDDHGRNHAFLMDDDGCWRPAPAYDLTLATNPLASGYRAGRINGKATGIARRDLIRLAAEHDIENAPSNIARVVDAVSRWMEHASFRGIPRTTAARVATEHRLSI